MKVLTGLAPIAAPDARLLILGSMPGAASLAQQQYYAFGRNHFWQLIFAVLDKPDPLTYGARIALLTQHKIALWDVVASCSREGSLDKDIRDAVPNDIPAFLRAHPRIRAVCFNGTAAQKVYKKHFVQMDGIEYLLLPSSSPVPRQRIKTVADKLPAWQALSAYLERI